jgi:hypothetical protein
MNGYSKFEIMTRDLIADLIAAGEYGKAREESRSFIARNKSRSLQRRHLLKATVRFWITAMNFPESCQ